MISTRKEKLLRILSKRDLDSLMEENGIKLAFLFGSVIDSSRPRDVDIGVLFQNYSFDVYSATYESLCKFLGIKDIDVVVLNRSNAAIKLEALGGVCCMQKTKRLYRSLLRMFYLKMKITVILEKNMPIIFEEGVWRVYLCLKGG